MATAPPRALDRLGPSGGDSVVSAVPEARPAALNSCGICGGGVRLFTGELHGRPITDWKHTWVPEGAAPHRPVLGTPVPEETLERLRGLARERLAMKEAKAYAPPIYAPPLVPPRKASTMPPAAVRLMQAALDYGWEVCGDPTYFVAANRTESVVLRLRRADLGVLAVWERKTGKNWAYDFGLALARGRTEQVGSNSLTNFIKQRDERCATCGRSSLTHPEECDA